MTVMQHFGAPTRLLDWTWSREVAAYFACIDNCEEDGRIWWTSHDAIVDSVHPYWEARGFTRGSKEQGDEVILDTGIFREDVHEFVSMVFLSTPFPRAEAQRALFTIGTKLGMLHDIAIAYQVDESERGQIEIPAHLKWPIIGFLNSRNIHAASLQHAGADRIGLRMSWERSSGLRQLTQEPENAER